MKSASCYFKFKMEVSCHKPEELLKTVQLQNDRIQQLTRYNAQCLENVQQQNKQIELLGQQLADSRNQQQLLLQRIQQLQQQQSRDDDVTPGLSNQQLKSASTPVLLNGIADELTSKSIADADCRISQLEAELRETAARLEESERQRQLVDEQAETSRRSYETDIAWLKMQLASYEEDFKSERRAREATAVTLEQVRAELTAAQRQLHQHSLQDMTDTYQRRQAALDYHRREYERTHPHQQQQQRPIYQTDSQLQLDSDEEGEDEID